MSWYNSDGLLVKLGTEEGTVGIGGETGMTGDRRELAFDMSQALLLSLTSVAGAVILGDNLWLPKNARIEEVEVEVITAVTMTGSGTFDLGLIRTDRSTQLDYDGLVAAAAKATLTPAGARLNLIAGSTAAGALIGTTLSNNGYLVANYNTGAFTAGALRVRIKYMFL